ncbi:MAG TPA: ATP-dependent Clp protease proteolytic subunit, partial [Candidatus Limnocylindrales bacterium]
QVKEMETLVNTNHQILSRHTGQPLEKIVADTSRDYFMSPTEAKDYGIIDAVYSASVSVSKDRIGEVTETADSTDNSGDKGPAAAIE